MKENIVSSAGLLLSGVLVGTFMTLLTLRYQEEQKKMSKTRHRFQEEAKHRRDRLPRLVILVRHGESEGNADHTLYRTKPDNLVELTSKGIHQSQEAGKRIEEIFKRADQNRKYKDAAIKRVHLVISPFERTLQTAAALRPCFEHRIVRTDVQPRIREQEFGNLQGHDFEDFRKSQKTVGRFWYRFPTGESGADVYDRVRSWWFDFVLNINERVGFEPIDALVIVTHGLTMRFLLMQLYDWSPTTFHSVWNADNCDLNILEKDLGKPGLSPYVLDEENGDMPKSSIDLIVELKSQPGKKQNYRLNDYLRIPRPRTTRLEIVKKQLAAQYPEIYVDDIESIMFMPFIDGANIQGRTSCGKRAALSFLQVNDRQDLQAFPNL